MNKRIELSEKQIRQVLKAGFKHIDRDRWAFDPDTIILMARNWGVQVLDERENRITRPSAITPNDPDSFDFEFPIKYKMSITHNDDWSFVQIQTEQHVFNTLSAIQQIQQLINEIEMRTLADGLSNRAKKDL